MTHGSRATAAAGLLGWWRAGTPEGRKAPAAGLGWMLDAFDVIPLRGWLTCPDQRVSGGIVNHRDRIVFAAVSWIWLAETKGRPLS